MRASTAEEQVADREFQPSFAATLDARTFLKSAPHEAATESARGLRNPPGGDRNGTERSGTGRIRAAEVPDRRKL